MTTDTTSGRIDQQLSSCPFCLLPYNRQTRTAVDSCDRCRLPLLPANSRVELLDDYLGRLFDLKSQWQGTGYQERVEAQIAKVEQIQASLPKKNRQAEVLLSTPLEESPAHTLASGDIASGLELKIQSLVDDRLNSIAQQVDLPKSVQPDDSEQLHSSVSQDLSDFEKTLGTVAEKVQTLEDEFSILKAVLPLGEAAQLPKLLNKIDSLEKELRKEKEYRKHLELHFSDRIHHITQAFEKLKAGQVPKAPPKPVSENDPRTPWWLERYHLSPQDILPLANSVEETPDSFARRNGHARVQGNGKGAIAFEKQSGNSKFWIILSDNSLDGQKIAYLVPRPNIKFNGYEQQSIQAYFELDEAEGQSNGQYQVTRPAIVTALSQGEQWELLERGLLELLLKNDLEEDHA